ncbi:MAG: large subunit ribosomal protein L25 [Patiriisocius sp.]|jgi:large subunit ribosomal protein L25
MSVKLEVTKREESAEALRAAGKLPAVVYGPKQEPVSITIDRVEFEKTLQTAGESTIISLVGLKEDIEVLVHDVAFNGEKGGVEHVDFYAIERGKELTTNVSLEFVGEAPVEKSGAMVTKVLHEIEVTCRPGVLPSHIDVDVTVLTEDSSHIQIKDLVIPEGVTLSADPEDMVASVQAAREEEAEAPVEAVDMDAVVVEEKGKGEVEEEAAA